VVGTRGVPGSIVSEQTNGLPGLALLWNGACVGLVEEICSMKSLSLGLIFLSFQFAGLAGAKHHSAPDASGVAVTAPASGVYEYNVRYKGEDGRLVFGDAEVSFESTNHPNHSMAWNYNMMKKLKTDPGSHEAILVFHGGETHEFKIMGDQFLTAEAANAVASRIAAAPRYHS
jgi:hypothetical protein